MVPYIVDANAQVLLFCTTSDTLVEGTAVKLSGKYDVEACDAGDIPLGFVEKLTEDGVAVLVKGIKTVTYTGTAPTVGLNMLAADGTLGVKGVEKDGQKYQVLAVDTTAKLIDILL